MVKQTIPTEFVQLDNNTNNRAKIFRSITSVIDTIFHAFGQGMHVLTKYDSKAHRQVLESRQFAYTS